MWSDKELDEAFGRLAPPEPAPEPFPLDAWLRLETQLDKVAMERLFRRRLWRFFLGEMAVVAVAALVWLAWPAKPAATQASPKGLTALEITQTDSRHSVGKSGNDKQATERRNTIHRANAPEMVTANNPAATPSTSPESATSALANTLATVATSATSNSPTLPSSGKNRPVVAASESHPHNPSNAPGAASDSAAMPAVSRRLPLAVASVKRHSAAASAKNPSLVTTGYASTTKANSGIESHRSVVKNAGKSALIASSKVRSQTISVTKIAKTSIGRPSQSREVAGVIATRHKQQPSFAVVKNQHRNLADAITEVSSPLNSTAGPEAGADNSSEIQTAVAELPLVPVALAADSAAGLPAPLATLPVAPPAPLPEPLHQPRLYLGLVGAPDVSTVKMADFQAPTANFGVTLEYRILDRLRVTTGFLRGTKNYRARRQDYDWSYYPIATNGNFDWVDGSCTIIDVPLNLRYDALVRPNYQLFGSAGLSSLFMQHETYAYDYSYSGRTYHWQRSFTNENQHWFGVLNLSAGYERSLSRHWRVQAEPYVKLPLGGVGAGKVRLASGGVFFGVKYGF